MGIRKKINKTPVSVESIYTFIWQDKKNGGVFIPICAMELKDTENKVITKGTIEVLSKNKVMIVERPEIVAKKNSWGCRS